MSMGWVINCDDCGSSDTTVRSYAIKGDIVYSAGEGVEREIKQVDLCNKCVGLRLDKLDKLEGCFDLVKYLDAQREWSEKTFGPGDRTAGLLDHIEKELDEIRDKPDDIEEWIDVIILALDGAWRIGQKSETVAEALRNKQAKNFARKWPDYRKAEPGKAIQHVKD